MAGVGLLFFSLLSARANIYATNIKLNGHTHTMVALQGNSVAINYILNETATAGVAVHVLSNGTLVRNLPIPGGQLGTFRGTNTIIWDGNNEDHIPVPTGFYSVTVTAATDGYDNWTQITDDSNPGNVVHEPRGIAVNQNTNSPYYGRVFVGNAPDQSVVTLANEPGMLKLNADGSPADEGSFSTGGYFWNGNFFSPWKIEVSSDDKVYINDWSGNGLVLAFDQQLTTNNYVTVLRPDNWPNNGTAQLSGPCITGSGTNTHIWMADNSSDSVGLVRWQVTADGTLATNDTGTVIVPITASNLTVAPYDVAVDAQGHIYTIQRVTDSGAPQNRVFRFPAYDESGRPETNMDWAVGSGDDTLANAYGISVDPTSTYVAVASRGVGAAAGGLYGGGVSIFNAADGTLVTNIIAETDGQHTDTAWDNVGNLYETDNSAQAWRAYSPPGPNETITYAVPQIQVVAAFTPPTLCNAVLCESNFHVTLLGQSNVTYVIDSSSDLINWSSVATNCSAGDSRNLTLSQTNGYIFFRARVQP